MVTSMVLALELRSPPLLMALPKLPLPMVSRLELLILPMLPMEAMRVVS